MGAPSGPLVAAVVEACQRAHITVAFGPVDEARLIDLVRQLGERAEEEDRLRTVLSDAADESEACMMAWQIRAILRGQDPYSPRSPLDRPRRGT